MSAQLSQVAMKHRCYNDVVKGLKVRKVLKRRRSIEDGIGELAAKRRRVSNESDADVEVNIPIFGDDKAEFQIEDMHRRLDPAREELNEEMTSVVIFYPDGVEGVVEYFDESDMENQEIIEVVEYWDEEDVVDGSEIENPAEMVLGEM